MIYPYELPPSREDCFSSAHGPSTCLPSAGTPPASAARRAAKRLLLSIALGLTLVLSSGWTEFSGLNEGTLTKHVYPSPEWGSLDLLVYTPPGYFTAGNTQRYPVLYFLHGSGGSPYDMVDALDRLPTTGQGGAEKLDDAILTGLLPPMIMVGIGAPSTNWEEEYLDLVTQDVVGHLDRNWRTVADRRGRSIEGFSSGARGVALYLTPLPELFASTSIMGGAFENYRWSDQGRRIRDRDVRVNILVGSLDGFLSGAQELRTVLQAEGIHHRFEVLDGIPHNCNLIYQARGLENLQFHAAAWAAASVVEAGDDLVLDGGAPASLPLSGQLLETGGYDVSWDQLSGPAGGASFTAAGSLSTAVNFAQIGTYGLRLTASGGGASYSDLIMVSVVDLAAGLEMYLPLDADPFDISGNGHDGVGLGGAAPVSAGKVGGAYYFDGVDDVVLVPDFDYGSSWSVAFWFTAPNLTGSSYQYMVSHGGFDSKPSLNAYLPENATSANGHVRTVLRDADDANGKYADAPGPFEGSVWHHYVLSVSPERSRP
ncbi:MAG: hypothetical protein MI919_27585, partial [Holophagales bacterium]|nr:hypothetical protein [Holophagales bacterium]